MPRIYSAYDLPEDRSEYDYEMSSMVHAEFKNECDINVILNHIRETGSDAAYDNSAKGAYIDCTSVPADYATAMQKVIEAKADFMKLSYKERLACNHDPAVWLDKQLQEQASAAAAAAAKAAEETSRGSETPPAGESPATTGDK